MFNENHIPFHSNLSNKSSCVPLHSSETVWGISWWNRTYDQSTRSRWYPRGSCGPMSWLWEDPEGPQLALPISGCINSTPQFSEWRCHDKMWQLSSFQLQIVHENQKLWLHHPGWRCRSISSSRGQVLGKPQQPPVFLLADCSHGFSKIHL